MNPYESPSPVPLGDPLFRNASSRLASRPQNTHTRRKSFDFELVIITGFVLVPIAFAGTSLALYAFVDLFQRQMHEILHR